MNDLIVRVKAGKPRSKSSSWLDHGFLVSVTPRSEVAKEN
jgi:hypothetical protein